VEIRIDDDERVVGTVSAPRCDTFIVTDCDVTNCDARPLLFDCRPINGWISPKTLTIIRNRLRQ